MTSGGQPGWRDDPKRPGIQRYWEGEQWAADIPPRAKPEPWWWQARVVVLGVLVAAAVIFLVSRVGQISDEDCREQVSGPVLSDTPATDCD